MTIGSIMWQDYQVLKIVLKAPLEEHKKLQDHSDCDNA